MKDPPKEVQVHVPSRLFLEKVMSHESDARLKLWSGGFEEGSVGDCFR